MFMLERYYELTRQANELDKAAKCNEHLMDELEGIWYKLTTEEKTKAGEYIAKLANEWSPEDKYNEACGVIENIKSLIAGSPNDITPLKSRLEGLAWWEKRRDEAKALMGQ